MFKLTFHGGTELARALEQLPEAVRGRVLSEALKASAEPVIEEAERLAPKSTDPREDVGHLAAHIEATTSRGRSEGTTIVVGPDKQHFYGTFIEFGTRFMSARPFLRVAWDGQVQAVLGRLTGALRQSIERTAKRLGGRR